MKARAQGLVCTVFYAVLFLGSHGIMAYVPLGGDPAWRTVLANLLAVGIGLGVAIPLGDRPFRARRTLRFQPMLMSALFGGGFSGVVLLVMTYIPLPSAWLERYTTQSGTPTDRTTLAWISALIVAPIAEELIFRGLLYPSLKRAITVVPAALLTSLLFGAIHGTLLWGIYTAILSLLAMWVIQRTGSLWAAILFHAAFNLCGQLPALFPSSWSWANIVYLCVCAIIWIISGLWLIRSNSR